MIRGQELHEKDQGLFAISKIEFLQFSFDLGCESSISARRAMSRVTPELP
jgi:hypothetical protein